MTLGYINDLDIYDGAANLKSTFHASGNDKDDDWPQIQSAIDSGAKIVYAPRGIYRFTRPIIAESPVRIVTDGGAVLRADGTFNDACIKIGFQSDTTYGFGMSGIQVDKTAGSTTLALLHIRRVQASRFEGLTFGNGLVGTASTTENILVEDSPGLIFEGIRSGFAGTYGIKFKPTTSYAVDAPNACVVRNCVLTSNTLAGLYGTGVESLQIHDNVFDDFYNVGQHGIHGGDETFYWNIYGNHFEAQTSASNDVRFECSSGGAHNIGANLHRGGPAVDIYLDGASNCNVGNFERSVTNGTFVKIKAGTDRTLVSHCLAPSSATFVDDAGTNTTIVGDKNGSAIVTRWIIKNAFKLQGTDNVGNLVTLAWVQNSNAVNFGDSSYFTFLDGARVTANGPLHTTEADYIVTSDVALTNAAGALTATLTNSPVAGNPTKWVQIVDNGTVLVLAAWALP